MTWSAGKCRTFVRTASLRLRVILDAGCPSGGLRSVYRTLVLVAGWGYPPPPSPPKVFCSPGFDYIVNVL